MSKLKKALVYILSPGLIAIAIWLYVVAHGFGRFSEAGKIKVIFRYDDYSSHSSTDFELEYLRILEKHGVQGVFGVIPYSAYCSEHIAGDCESIPLEGEKAALL